MNELGDTLQKLGRMDEAVEYYAKAIACLLYTSCPSVSGVRARPGVPEKMVSRMAV